MHHCSEECSFITFKDFYICKQTGNLHYCTEDTCDHMIRTPSHMVCSLSSTCYPLCFEDIEYHTGEPDGDDEEMEEMDSEDREIIELDFDENDLPEAPVMDSPSKPTTIITGGDGEVEEEEQEQQQPTAKRRRTKSTKKARNNNTSETTDAFFTRHTQFMNALNSIFPKEKATQELLFQTIATNVERLWTLIEPVAGHGYRPEYHLLVILHCMCTGYQPMGQSVVPYNQFVQTHLPLIRDMHRLRGSLVKNMKVRAFTLACKTFKTSCMKLLQHPNKRAQFQWTSQPKFRLPNP